MADAGPTSARSGSRLEFLVLGHVAVLLVGVSWAFGGQIDWARTALRWWGSVGIGLFLAAVALDRRDRWRWLGVLWPLLAFDAVILVAGLNPGLRSFVANGTAYFALAEPPRPWLPSSARPDLAALALWQLNGIVISCYNLAYVVTRRGRLRALLGVVALNAVALAIFGTFQRLAGADGLWFGRYPTPQPYFFATFVYHNHWGAFTLLGCAACLGLLFHAWRAGDEDGRRHSPVFAGAVAILLLAATIPLSGSRSSTILAGLLLLGAFLHGVRRVLRARAGRRAARGVFFLGAVAALGLAAIVYVAGDMISRRAAITREQVHRIQVDEGLNSRLTLYRDTWEMARRKPWFGWGLESYGDVFRTFNTQRAVEARFGQPFYREAHSDWLQSLAETGFLGTGLLVLLGGLPLWRARRGFGGEIPGYLLAGLGAVLVYAALEFPFANPAVAIGFWCALYTAARHAALDAGARSGQTPT